MPVSENDFKWDDASYMPHEDTATVRVVVDERAPRSGRIGRRYCFTHFPADVTLEVVLAFIAEKKLPIDVDSTCTEIDVETREWIPGIHHDSWTRMEVDRKFSPWTRVKRLQGPIQYRVTHEKCDGPEFDGLRKMMEGKSTPLPDGNKYVKPDPNKHKLVFNYPAGNNAARMQQELNASKVKGCPATACPRDPNGNWQAVECVVAADWTPPMIPDPVIPKTITDVVQAMAEASKIMDESVKGCNVQGPTAYLHQVVLDELITGPKIAQARAEFIEKVRVLAESIDSGELSLDPFVLLMLRRGIRKTLQENSW